MQNFNLNSALMYPEPLPFWKGLLVRSQPFLMAVGLHACVFASALVFHYGYGEPVFVANQTEEAPLIIEYIAGPEIIEPVAEPTLQEEQEIIEEPEEIIEEIIEKIEPEPLPPIVEEAEIFTPDTTPIEKPKPRLKEVKLQTKPQIKKTSPPKKTTAAPPLAPPTMSQAVAASPVPKIIPKKNSGFIKPVYPSYLRNPAPPYPKKARKRKQEGVVLLFVQVSDKGRPINVRIKKTSGITSLDRSALNTVKKWKFLPARKNNTAITANVIVPIRFALHQS